ncbi:MAG: phage minor capsid protein [Ruminococcus sp.]
MLSPEYYENCADIILAQYAELEDAILRDIIRRMMKTGTVTESAKWQALMLQEAGLLYSDIVKEIADRTDACSEQVKALFEDAGVETVQIDNEIYREAGLVPVDIRQSPSMRQVLEAGYRNTLGNLDNLTRTTASAGQREYIEACNGAYMKVASGAFSYQEAVSSAVHNVAENGVRLVLYDSGHRDRLSVAVRRAVLTGLSQTCGEISRMNAEEMDCDLMEIDAHAGARPSHAVWQGKLVSLSGKNTGRIVDGIEVLSLSDIGYGTGAGFKGWNCSHEWFPYFEGFSTPNHTPEELEEMNARNIEWNGELHTRYEINQMQRRAEQNIRRLKRKLVTYDEAVKNAPDDSIKTAMQKKFQDSAVNLKAAEQKLSEFCRATGNDRDKFREQEIGFGRSQAQRAVWANKKDLKQKEERAIIEEIKACGIKGTVHITPLKIKADSLTFDYDHINQRNHNVSRTDAISYIENAKFSVARWNGKYENYYSDSGAAFVETETNHIRTAFNSDEFTDQVQKALEVIKKYGK